MDIEDESFPLPQANETVANSDDGSALVSHSETFVTSVEGDGRKGNDVPDDNRPERTVSCNDESLGDSCGTGGTKRNERTDEGKPRHPETLTSSEQFATTKNERETSVDGVTETPPPRISLIKPPRIIAKLGTPEPKQGTKHGDRKSNIPIFRRSSREFEDIGSPQETAKRSLIPQRYFYSFLRL